MHRHITYLATALAGLVLAAAAAGSHPTGGCCSKAPPAVTTTTSPAPLNLLDANQGWIVKHPRIYNVYWDSDWTAHNSWSRHDVDVATARIVGSGYFAKLAQYGVTEPVWKGSHRSADGCVIAAPKRAPTTIDVATLVKWVTCEVSTLAPQSRVPVSDDVYVIYLPERTTLISPGIPGVTIAGHTFGPYGLPAQCVGWSGFHAAALSVTGPFAFAVVASKCANGSLSELTKTASHELAEMIGDPIPTQGWIDDSFSGLNLLLDAEAADLCEIGPHAVAPVPIAGTQLLVDPYWSNEDAKCVA